MENMYTQVMQTPEMKSALMNSSVSAEDARIRSLEYAKMFSRVEETKADFGLVGNQNMLQKTFSGYAETPLLSNQYFNASVASYVSSFAGYVSIEREFPQPNGLFYWFDVLGVSDMRTVIPNMGPDSYQDIQTMGDYVEVDVTPTEDESGDATTSYEVIIGRKLIPGTTRVNITTYSEGGEKSTYTLIDNGQGNLLAIANKITSGTISYLTGLINFELVEAVSTEGSIKIVGKEDVVGTPCGATGAGRGNQNEKRFIAKMQQFGLATVPDMLVAEYSIAALGAMKKATGSDMATFLFTKLREIYTKTINYNLISTLENDYSGNVMSDLSLDAATMADTFYDYRSRIDLFDNYLVNVESELAVKAVKGVNVTCYVAGATAANHFQKGSTIGKFEKNTKMTYINDLLGWYNGLPVLRSTDIAEEAGEGTFYAIHKTADGQMAPLARGIYMPLTDTPTIGNYNNPTQMAAGIYYQEGTKTMANELVQKVTFKAGI